MVVVDCDSHVMEPADLWQRYLEPKFRDRAIRIEERDGVETLVIGEEPKMAVWRANLFAFLSRNAMDASSFFGIPSNQVIEVGVRLEI